MSRSSGSSRSPARTRRPSSTRLTCRDLTKCAVGQGKYVLITAEDGGIVNDPVLLRVEADRWWLALADSDAGLWARGVADPQRHGRQGPRARGLPGPGPGAEVEGRAWRRCSGRRIHDIRTTGRSRPSSTASRSSSAGPAGPARSATRSTCATRRAAASCGTGSWRPAVRTTSGPSRPCEARRIEAGIFNYGSDMTIENNPFEVMGLERLVEPQDGRLHRQGRAGGDPRAGVERKLVGIEVDGDALPFELSRKCVARHRRRAVGTVTDLIWSPRLERNIGYVWVPIELAGAGHAARDRGARRRSLARAQRPRSRSSTRRSRCRSAIDGRRVSRSPVGVPALRSAADPPRDEDRDRGDGHDDRGDRVDLGRDPELDRAVDVERQGRDRRSPALNVDHDVVVEAQARRRAGRRR